MQTMTPSPKPTKSGSCCGGDKDCCALPPEFVRVRYFYGQRLGVMELSDEASYHASKDAFHNARAHGFGVLCGLSVDRFLFGTATTTTALRVHKGAALDTCGREIVVGCDQCIDVGAWFAKNKARPELAGWTAGTTQKLYVAVRYHECPTDPAPAPRDACGCDANGCEFGRVREGFELALLTEAERSQIAIAQFPSLADLHATLDGALQGNPAHPAAALRHAFGALLAKECPGPGDARWLGLAEVDVILDATPTPVDLGAPTLAIKERRSLLPTSALQELVVDLLVGSLATGALPGAGPRLGALAFTAASATSGTLRVPVALASTGSPATPVPLVDGTFDPATVTLEALDTSTGWSPVTLGVGPLGNVAYDASTTAVVIPVESGLAGATPPAARPIYRLTIAAATTSPPVDALGRPLGPLPYSRTFAFLPDGATIALDPAL